MSLKTTIYSVDQRDQLVLRIFLTENEVCVLPVDMVVVRDWCGTEAIIVSPQPRSVWIWIKTLTGRFR